MSHGELPRNTVIEAEQRCDVTFLMAAYNAERTIGSAIGSIAKQTCGDWRLLVVDDGSTDRTVEICEGFARNDSRVRIVRSRHRGLCETLNLGLRLIKTKYVARLDADDTAYPSRLEKQLAFLRANPAIKVLGTRGHRISASGDELMPLGNGPTTLEEYNHMRSTRGLFFLLSSSVIAETNTLLEYGGYREGDYPAEDTALHTRIAKDHVVLMLPEPLVAYRMSSGGITARGAWSQMMQIKRLDYNLERGADINLAEFQKVLDRHPLKKFRVWWCCLHKYAVRSGIGHWSEGRRVLGAAFMFLGSLLLPVEAARRAIRRY